VNIRVSYAGTAVSVDVSHRVSPAAVVWGETDASFGPMVVIKTHLPCPGSTVYQHTISIGTARQKKHREGYRVQ
jgi:hypothetical protein